MKKIVGLILIASLASCSVCKSSDSPEVCRTKERDHSQPHAGITINGGMDIGGASHVEGGILVEKPSGELIQMSHDVPRIVIGPGATVQGDLRFERTVQLYVSDKATIGAVTGATPIPFSGDAPPN
jgi:hypothetical protein